MKIRTGFVSNSSSSSFICDITGGVESGYDCSYDDLGMSKCERGHVFYTKFLVKELDELTTEEKKDFLIKYHIDEDEEGTIKDIIKDYGNPSAMCPICSMKKVSLDESRKYMLKKLNLSEEKLKEEILNNFHSYNDYIEYIR